MSQKAEEVVCHALERTSPKGGPFIGRCMLCGAMNLRMSAVFQPCPNPDGVTNEAALISAIEGMIDPRFREGRPFDKEWPDGE